MKAQAPDAFKMFMNAERYRIADLHLRSEPDPRIAVSIADPALILSAFASEIYLKCLICIETASQSAHGHHLRKLFKQLSGNTRHEIERRWIAYTSTPLRQRTYAGIRSLTGQLVPEDLNWTLQEGSEAFISLRYMHEQDSLETKFLLGDFPGMLREVILEIEPEWRAMTHGLMLPIAGSENPINNS